MQRARSRGGYRTGTVESGYCCQSRCDGYQHPASFAQSRTLDVRFANKENALNMYTMLSLVLPKAYEGVLRGRRRFRVSTTFYVERGLHVAISVGETARVCLKVSS